MSQYTGFLSGKNDEQLQQWSFGVEDESDPDDGYVRKDGKDGSDYKEQFHWSRMLDDLLIGREILPTRSDSHFLDEAKKLFVACETIAFSFASRLDSMNMFSFNVVQEMQESIDSPHEWSRSKIRLLQYLANAERIGARPHKDKSFISVHVGDIGGDLYMCNDREGSGKQIITPSPDEALVFFGLKAEVLSDGIVKALWHGADADSGNKRSACVFFGHVNCVIQSSWDYVE